MTLWLSRILMWLSITSAVACAVVWFAHGAPNSNDLLLQAMCFVAVSLSACNSVQVEELLRERKDGAA